MFIYDIYILKESRPIEIKRNEEATIDLELKKVPPCYYTLLTGKVRCNNMPIKNATVMVLDEEYKPLFHTVTDEDGVYKFSNLLNPGMYNVIASGIGYKTSKIVTVNIREDIVIKQSFTLKKSSMFEKGIVYGKILESGSRKPIENAIIDLKSREDNGKTIYQTTSNCSGQYLIYNILPNDYIITIKKQGYMESSPLELTIKKYDCIQLYFDLIKDNHDNKNTISGFITYCETFISNVGVFLYRLDKQGKENVVQIQESNENGFYLFSNVENGSYVVKAKLENNIIYEKKFEINYN